jgi:hypothetical protein
MQLRRVAQPAANILLASLFACLLISQPRTAQAQQVVCGSDDYLANLPVKPPKDPNTKRQIQLVNCSDQVVLGAANAARAAGAPPWPVFPQEDTWVMQAFNSENPTDYSNVLTIDIPSEWYGQHQGGNTGNFWVRTGCRYDQVSNRAQCETGGCSGQYDCSSGNISPPPGTTIVEWTFYQQFSTFFFDFPDISAVNGANLTVDVSPKGGDDLDPQNSKNWHWLKWDYPLTVHGADLREPGNCALTSDNTFKIFRADIDKTISSGSPGYPLLGYVIVDGSGNPTMPTGNNALSCLSNCGKYKFPLEVAKPGCNPVTDSNCYFWDTFCAGDPGIQYGQQCNTDADCLKYNNGVNYHIACFKKAGPNQPGTCELRGFFNSTVALCNGQAGTKCGPSGSQCAAPTSAIACTNTYGSINPLDPDNSTKYDWADQPILGKCTDVIFAGNGQQAACIGDDTVHKILHGAYTWPNDPQVYQGDAPVYRIVFSPEGRGKAPITAAQALPACDSLPPNYMPSQNRTSCGGPIDDQNAALAIAKVRNQPPNQWQSTGSDWPCSVGSQRDAADNGIICFWNPPPANYNCLAPKTDSTYVTNGACGRIDSGTSLVSGSMTPGSTDPLFVEVSIPKVLNTVSLPSSITGCAASWTLLASQAVNTNQGIVAWYKGLSNASSPCQVTVTLTSENPAEVKVYDVPKFNGTLETMSTMSGNCNLCGAQAVTAGSATTAFSSDLQMGALLMVNQVPAPITYWQNWLSNGTDQSSPTCLDGNTNCPRDDGPDYLPGHGPYSGNSDVGHNQVGPGTQYFHYNANIIDNQSSFSWVGLAIYIELKP